MKLNTEQKNSSNSWTKENMLFKVKSEISTDKLEGLPHTF